MMGRWQTLLEGNAGRWNFSPRVAAAGFPSYLRETRLKAFLKGGEDLREGTFSFADNGDIRDARSEKKGMAKGDLRAADNHFCVGESQLEPPQEVKGALYVPQIQGAAEDIRLPIENPFQKMPVVKLLFFKSHPLESVRRGKACALRGVEQKA
jgi:hypothetical protein